jgi:hypothetical protein
VRRHFGTNEPAWDSGRSWWQRIASKGCCGAFPLRTPPSRPLLTLRLEIRHSISYFQGPDFRNKSKFKITFSIQALCPLPCRCSRAREKVGFVFLRFLHLKNTIRVDFTILTQAATPASTESGRHVASFNKIGILNGIFTSTTVFLCLISASSTALLLQTFCENGTYCSVNYPVLQCLLSLPFTKLCALLIIV